MKEKKEYVPWNRYIADDLPPVKNYFVYCYRIFFKTISFIIFGAGSLALGLVVFPLMRFFIHPSVKFRKKAHLLVHYTFKFFTAFMTFFHVFEIRTEDKKLLKKLKSKIIVANHPSLLDVVCIISLVPDADCIVRGGLANGVVGGVVRQIYLTNSSNYDLLEKNCISALKSGSNLIIFPEGTRTPRHGKNQYKKGAARIALSSNCAIVPLYIGGTDKYGLGKHDPFLSFNHEFKYIYKIKVFDSISPKTYNSFTPQIAAKRITEKIYKQFNEDH